MPIPPIDLYTAIVDVLAKRYGWSLTEIRETMYWEEVYELYEYASNVDAIELNRDMKFNFMLHAGSKDAINSWEDLKIPFPARDWKEPGSSAELLRIKRAGISRSKASKKQQERMIQVRKRMEEHRKKLKNRGR